jgi:hypothetical protein
VRARGDTPLSRARAHRRVKNHRQDHLHELGPRAHPLGPGPWAGHVNYAASKGGVMQMMKSVARRSPTRRSGSTASRRARSRPTSTSRSGARRRASESLDLVSFGGNWAISVSGNWRHKGCRGLHRGPPARRARDRGRDPRFLPGRRPAPSLLTAVPNPSTAGACDVTWTRHLAVQTLRLPRARPTGWSVEETTAHRQRGR